MKIEFLNHASIILEDGGIRLLTDPWFFGTCFQEGWGLRFENPSALEQARTCSHLWISHFHSDHLHLPTLKKISELNPDIVCLSNVSANFQMDGALRRAGFKNIAPFHERKALALSPAVSVVRYPATGIDNMMLWKGPEGCVLNYNDCLIPIDALKRIYARLESEFGPIDFFLNNFNHASKLWDLQENGNAGIREDLRASYKRVIEAVSAKHVVPFASHHYYRAPHSLDQNQSMLRTDELADLDPRIIPLKVGQSISFQENRFEVVPASPGVIDAVPNVAEYGEMEPGNALAASAEAFCGKINASVFKLAFWIPDIVIAIEDSDQVLRLNVFKQAARLEPARGQAPHISAHSAALAQWFSRVYGSDSFYVGGHFKLMARSVKPFRSLMFLCMLADHRLDPRSLLNLIVRGSGLGFLLNRREEIYFILRRSKLKLNNRRL